MDHQNCTVSNWKEDAIFTSRGTGIKYKCSQIYNLQACQTVLQFGLKTSQLDVLLTTVAINKPVNAILKLIAYVSREGPAAKALMSQCIYVV